nr:hypothetical protein [Nocardia gipuzkoensis]
MTASSIEDLITTPSQLTLNTRPAWGLRRAMRIAIVAVGIVIPGMATAGADEWPKISVGHPTEHDCLVVNGEYQRYYRTSGCTLSGNPTIRWWFEYWPK